MVEVYVLGSLLALLVGYGIRSYFADRHAARLHESKLTLEVCAKADQTNETIRLLGDLVKDATATQGSQLDNFKMTLVAVLTEMRDLTKDLDADRKKTATKATATLLGRRMPSP